MSVLNNLSAKISRGLQRLRHKDSTTCRITRCKSNTSAAASTKLKMEKCLIVSKVTRYEYEKHSYNDISDEELEKVLKKRGSDYNAMMETHRKQKAFEDHVKVNLQSMGIQVEMANRLTYNTDLINWCDVVMPCGGDGTFLLAASKVRDVDKPVIGFNSAPQKSVGRLCLPTWCSNDVKGAILALQEGRFKWMRRTRIRTTMTCEENIIETIAPIDVHTLHYSRYPPVSHTLDASDPPAHRPVSCNSRLCTKVLPYLALNEVFMGESVTSRVSILGIKVDSGPWTHTKSSGLCVTTGTGSTSWHFSINCLRSLSVLQLLRILSEDCGANLEVSIENARKVAEMYNERLMFPPDSPYLAYSVREYITFEAWPAPRGLRVRDRATAVRVRSHCDDAGLVIDGSVSYPFNDGTEVQLEVHPEDALMTVQLPNC